MKLTRHVRRVLRPVKRAATQVIAGESRLRLNALVGGAKSRHDPGLPRVLILGDLAQYGLHVSMLHNALTSLRADVTFDDFDAPLAFKWAPWSEYSIPDDVRARLKARKIVNDTHFSCDKDNVARCFAQSFGYGLAVDPRVTTGPIVRKSQRNATHDGAIVNGPIPPEPGFSYAALIRNEVGDLVEDIRLPIVGRSIPFAYLKYRPAASRFSNKNAYAGLVGCASILSMSERANVLEFARLIGLEFGEIDALRDRISNRLYIVDANNTASGPPNGLPPEEAAVAIDLVADAIVQEFVAPLVASRAADDGVR